MKKTIAFITDMHLKEKLPVDVNQQQNWQRILRDIAAKNADVVIIGGDIGHPTAYEDFFASLENYAEKLYVIPGNHDTVVELLQHFPNPENLGNAELFYSLADGNFLYLFLDSSTDSISEPQLHWLQEKLEENNLKVLLFVHHPIFEIDTPVDRKYPLQNRDAVLDILMQQSQEVFIFCGHYHTDDETGTGAFSQFETPAVSYQIRKGTNDVEPHAEYFAYRLITLENGNVRSEIVRFS